MTREEKRQAFLKRWIPYGINLLARAEAHGVDWEKISLEKLEAEVLFAEEWATPDEFKSNPFQQQRRKHG